MDTANLSKRTLDFIRNQKLLHSGDHVLVAVSGGPDSIALLHILEAIKYELGVPKLTVVHFDHQLRGKASLEDYRFVRNLAEDLNLPFFSDAADVRMYQKEHGVSLEMAARVCRYEFFKEAMDELEATKVALGHHADDQAEELLLRLMRGTGPAGMAGMQCRTQDGIIRPLLFASKVELMNYISEMNLDFRRDGSNLEPFCQRNMLRLEIIPLLAKHFHANLTQTLCRHARLVQEEETYWSELIEELWPKISIECSESRIILHLPSISFLHPALLKRIFRIAIQTLLGNLLGFYAVHFKLIDELIQTTNKASVLQLPRQIWILKEADKLVFAKHFPFSAEPFCWPIDKTGTHDFFPFQINFSLKDFNPSDSPPITPELVWMDAKQVQWPLTVRSWRPGDRFQPLGMKGSKKLQDFFTDLKIPRSERGGIALLCDRQKVCWVMGYRLDERVKITPETTHVLVVQFRAGQQ